MVFNTSNMTLLVMEEGAAAVAGDETHIMIVAMTDMTVAMRSMTTDTGNMNIHRVEAKSDVQRDYLLIFVVQVQLNHQNMRKIYFLIV